MSNLFYVNSYPVFNSNPPPPPTLTPRGLHMHQFSIDSPEIFFFSTSIVYLSNPYNKQAPRPLEGKFPLYILFIYPLYRFLGSNFFPWIATCCIYPSFKIPKPVNEQGMLGGCPGKRKPNLEGGHPDLVTKVLCPKSISHFSSNLRQLQLSRG